MAVHDDMNGLAKPHWPGRLAGLCLAGGVLQMAPIYSGQTSWEGMNDTSSLDKTITAVVTATFALK
jgi:hypothetical protein